MSELSGPSLTSGTKMMFLIRRRSNSTREELLLHWFANHMPGVIRDLSAIAQRYTATLFDADASGTYPWDGVAQILMAQPLPNPTQPYGTEPSDSFQEHAEPYVGWATQEHIVIDGAEKLLARPLTLNAPYPCTRSGFHKVTYLVKAKPDTDWERFFDHWLTVHSTNVAKTLEQSGGFHYAINLSSDPSSELYAGMAELYFAEPAGWQRYQELITADGMEQWVDRESTLVLPGRTEMIGIQ